MVNGNNIFISLDGTSTPFAATRSNEIQVESEKIPISSPNTGDWEEHIIGKKKWGFSVNWLIGDADKIKNLLMVGQTYTISVYGRAEGTTQLLLKGKAICLSARVTLTKGSIANGSFSFEGNGLLYLPVTGITISPTSLSLGIGTSQQITPSLTPNTASVRQLLWTSSDQSVATVDDMGIVTAVSEGTCTITCSSTDISGVIATCSCEVHPIPVTAITLSNDSLNIRVNQTLLNPITAEISPGNATNKTLLWSSSNQQRMPVEQNGDDYTIRGYVPGSYSLIASATDDSETTAICQVTVIQ